MSKYKCKNLMKVSVYAHHRFTPGTRIFARNNGKEFVVSEVKWSLLLYNYRPIRIKCIALRYLL